MKIAVVGKGGSGKSTVSWLLTSYVSLVKKQKLLAIDADHNMDLATCHGLSVTDQTKLLYMSDQEFRTMAGMPARGRFAHYLDLKPLEFSYNPTDDFLQSYCNPINPNLDLIVMGLGDESIMYGDKCSHGLSAPLKYILPTLHPQNDSWVIIDSVAGADMVNFGLYFGCDLVVCAAEPRANSIKVAKQLKYLCHEQGIPLAFVLNKWDLTEENRELNPSSIVGRLPSDMAVINCDFDSISSQTLDSLDDLVTGISQFELPTRDQYQDLKAFEHKKASMALA